MASSARRRDAGRSRARHHKHKNPARAQATYPTFRLDAQAATSTADNANYGRYIGRVGGLAVALGVGAALTTGLGAGIAHAGPSTKNTTHDSSPTTPRTKSPKTAKTAPRTATRPAAPTSDGPPDAVDETGPDATETPTQADVDATVATPASTADTSALTAAPPSSEPDRAYSDASAPAAPDTSVLPTGSTPSAAISLPSPTDDTATAPQTLGTDFGTNSSPAAGAGTPSAASLAPIAAAPSAKTSVMQVFVSTLLSPFLAPGPAAPCQPPLMWAMLASVVREFQRTFFNRSPVVLPQEVTLVLEPDGTSSPTAFDGHDGDGDRLTYIVPARGVPGGPSHGWVTVDELTGTFTYTRDGDYTGPDQFTVTASDAGNGFHMHGLLGFLRPAWGHTDTATITIDVVAAETPPTVNNDFFTTPEDIPVLGSVLSNDSDPNDQTLTTTLLSEPSNGSVTLEQNGVFNYTPNPDWNGVDGFTYRASNRTASASASVSIVVTPVNKAPQNSDDLYTTTEDTAISGNVLNNDTDPDGDAITAGLVMPASHGNVQLNADGSFSYTPATNFHGTDGFSYVASDGSLSSAPTLVTITVTPVNDAPVAQNDNYVVNEDSILTGSVLPNDTDADGDSLAVSLGVGPAHGSLTLNPNGSFSYIPAANYNGTDSFTYTVTDGAATSNSATATITVNAVNDTPVASDASINVNEDASYTGTVSVIDVDGDSVTSEVVNGPAHGSLVFDGSGAFVYTPAANYAGTDSFTYTATDGVGTSSVARVSITVTPVNDTPVAVNDTFTANEDSILTGSVLSNDTDVDGNTLTATTVIGPSHGTLVLNADGSFSYTPDADYAGADSFAYVADDGTATSSVATVSITISPVNDAPVAGDDIFSINEDSSLTGNLLANDSDVDGDSLTASLTEGPGNGTLEFNSDGTFTYTPSANFNGVDWFTYTVSDGVLSSAPALVVVLVDPVNDVPVAGNDSYTVNEDSTLAGNVLSNDSDAESLSLTATLVSGPTHGTLTLYPNGSFTYTPAPNYKGTDSFTYTASDGTAISSVAVVSISVAPDNKVPVANADSYTGNEDSALAGNVLANDTDADGNTLTATLISGPAHGSLELNADGTFTYTPVLNYNGADSFTYTASDGTATSSVATVSITVSAVNDTPVAVGDAASTDEDTVLTGNVLSNDSDVDGNTLTASLVDGPANGTLTLNPDGSFTYTPDADFNGADSFTYTASDGTATSSVATVSITVDPVNDTPIAVGDSFSMDEDTALTGTVLTNDTDVDGDTLTATLVDGPTNGTLTLNPDGSFTYTPDADFNGADSFTYTASDGTATSSVATVSITVDPVNDTPIAVGDSFSMDEDTALTGTVLTNDTDVDGDTLTATLVDGPTNGTLTLNADGSFTYTPDADSNGADSFTYTAGDGTATSSVATVSITVNPVNDTPVTVDDTLSTNEDTVLTGNVLTNDTDNDADTLTATLVDGPTRGTLTLNPDGSFTYTPDTNFNGTDSFTYTAGDGTATSSVATVSITVDPINDAPVAVGDAVSTDEDTVLSGNVLTNDSDTDGDTLTATLVAGPASGTLTLNPDGSFTYTPDTDFNGTDSFTYTATDGTATSSVATVSITVNPVNDTPVTVADSFSTDEDTVLTGNVLSNDSDVDGDTLTATLVDGTTNGTLTLNADGSFTYTPDADFNGADSFTYTAGDGTSTSSVATVSITVNPVNDTPATTDNSFSTDEDTPLSGNVLTNDSDVDGDTLTATLVDGPTNGTLTLNADGTFTYTPDTDFNGSDSFTYTATDGTATSSVATVSITVNPVNDAPVTVDDSVSTNEDTVLTGNVLTNDSDTDGDTLTATLVDGPANGTLTLNPDGSFTYTPDTDFNGADSFTYTASDGTSTSSVATVSITVNPVNDTPVTVADSFTTDEDTALTGNVLSNDSDSDGDTLTATLVDGPANGTLTLNADGSFTYTPDTNFNGTDSFTYTATDGTATSSVATVSITVNPVNDAPVAVGDAVSTDEDTALTGNVLTNDSDVDGDTLTATLVDGPANGTLTLNPDGSFTYTPDADFNGADSFTYTATDGTATSSVATVSITVNPVNDAPVAVGDTVSTDEDTVLTGNVLTNDSDVDGDTLTATLVDGPTNGTLTLNPDGSFTYTPDTDFNGADSFTYTAGDGTATSSVATVSITVNPVNDAPVAVGDTVSTDEDTVFTGNVLTNDSDIDGDTLTASLVDGPANGTLTLNPDGTFTYTPDTNFNGTDSFTYTASDGTTTSNTATVSITVSAVNDAPVAVGDTVSTDEDTILTGNVLTNDTDNDADTLTATLVDGPTRGTLTLNPDGSFTYTPDTNFNGTDSFTYTAGDGTATSSVATVSITVDPINDAPVAVGDTVSTDEDTPLSGNVLSNDTDNDADTLTATLVDGPTNGTLTLNPDGSFTYTPDTDFNGADSFTYTAGDGAATSSVATVSITVNPVNDTPATVNESFSTNEDTPLSGNVLTNDSDTDGDTLTATLVAGPASGTLTLNADGSFTYTPDTDFNGTDSFTYTATDGTATSSVATVSITVNPINDAPVTVGDTVSTNEDTPLTGNVLPNDSDIDGDTLTATLVDGPANGTLTLNADGSFTYTPDTDFNGSDSFTYTAGDGTATSSVATVSITVNPVNDTPVTVADSFTTDEDTVLTGNVLSNDSDIDGNTLTATLVDGPANGTLTLNADGTFTYTPAANYNGTDSFTYTASDGTTTSSVATVSITVNPVNDTPVTVADSFTTDEDTVLTGNVLSNDSDIDGNTLTATLVDGPANGTLTLNADGTFTYTPAANYNGTDSFTYTASDGTTTSSVATVSITVNPVNDTPVTVADSFTTDEDTTLTGNVLSNDSDIDADTLTTTLVDGPTNGTLTLNADGSFTYTPDTDFNGADSFTYTATDGTATSSVATVSITVNPVNDTPVTVADSFTTDEDTTLTGNVLSNDSDIDADTLTTTLVDGPTNGTLTLNADGSFTYTPDTDFNGTDSFTYTAGDGTATSSVATVSITVNPVNDAPVAVGDTVSTDEDTVLTGNVLTNDSDVDGDTLTATLVDGPTNGTLTLNPDGSFIYTPDTDFNGADSFTYTAGDGTATSSIATVSITVDPINDTPVAVGDTVSTDEDTVLTGNVLSNDTDNDADTLTATLVDGPTNGTLTLNPDGSFTYTPDTNFNGADSFTYTATDGTATSSVATVTITVNPVNDAPVAVGDAVSTDEDTPLTGNVLTNDLDADGDTLTATLVDGPTNGTLALNPDGTFTYTPDTNFNGTDSFTYTATDGTATSSVATVSITVNPVNDAPVAVSDAVSTDEDTVLTGNVLTNDSDTDGDTLTATLVDGPTNGTLTLNPDGSFTYTPDTDFNGFDSFTYTATDSTTTSPVATVSITVNPVNDTPVTAGDTVSTDEDTVLTGNVLTNDSDVDGDTLTVTLVDGPANGTLTLNPDGSFTYTPDTNFNGADSFTYTASDGTATGSIATVSITVNAVNDTPVAVGDTVSTDEDTVLTGNVLNNDSDVDGDTLTATLVDGPTSGTLTLNADGSFTYTPDADFNGADSFTYTAGDGTATSSVATVSITVNPINDTPVTVNDSSSTAEDTTLTGNVLSNDSDNDGDTLTATLVDGPTNGAVTLNADGSFTYTPDTNFNGTDSFTYTASDGTSTSSVATVSITVNPINDAPVAVGDAVSTNEDTVLTGNVLTNDTDNDADTLTATLVDGPANGTLTLNPDGSFTYTPDTNFNGADSFTYTATDGTSTSSVATVSITVNPVNDTPVTVNDTVSTNEDTTLTGNVLTNDTDNDADTLTATLVDGPTNGTLTLNADGSFTYTPGTDFNGADSFTYTATDGTATSSVATVSITIDPVNDAPVAVGDTVSTDEDTPLSGNVLTNDSDIDADTLTATLVDGPTNGTLTLNPDGSFTYTPDADFNGADSFTYTTGDGAATSSVATVSITVNPVNDAPVAVGDAVSTDEDTPLSGNVLTNDTDVDGDTLTATLVDGPTNGTLTLNADGSFTYTPDSNFNGADSFTYTAGDGTTTSSVATVSITIDPVNDAPVAVGDTVSTDEDTPLSGNVLSNDSDIDADTLTATLVDGPTNGTLTLNADGSFTYTPDSNFNGADSFTYTTGDGAATSSVATVSITVNPVNDAPVAVGDAVSTDEDTPLSGNVLTNDTDVDGDTLTATLVDGPTNGTLTLNPDGSFTYTPDTNFNGTDSFTYTATDGTATSSVATVSITVAPVNDTPITVSDSFSTDEDTPLSGNVLTNDTDVDGDTLTATLVDGPTNGTLTLNPDGSFTYTPDANYNGADSFTYTASDGTATSPVSTVTITIDPVNDAPVAVNDSFSTNEDTVLTGNVLSNDSDTDGDTLTATLVNGPTNGTLTLNADGSFTYTPDADFNGADSFTYTATDGTATSDTATVSITVNPVNDAPVAVDDSFSTDEDSILTGTVLSNDTDTESDTLTATLVDGPTNGTLTLNADGTFTYTPDSNYNGADSFTYTVTDGTATSNTATVTITVNAVNDAPVAEDDSFTFDEDNSLSASVLSNDSDIDGDTLTTTLVDGPTNGTLTLNADGTFTYTPDADYNGTDSFTYTVSDGTSTSSVAAVSITVDPINDAPIANNDSYSIGEDSTLTGNVLTNDTDADADTLTATLVDGPTHGTLTLNADGSFTYTPTADYTGIDSFSYRTSDGSETSNTALVTIAVTAINDAPVAGDDSFSTNEDTQVSGNVLSNDTDADGDTLTATLVSGPTHGTLTLNTDGTFTYTPTTNYNGTDSFTYAAGDGSVTDNALVTISITSVNDTPVAAGDNLSINEDSILTGNVLSNDTDADGNTLTATLVSGPTHGTLTLNTDGTFTYTPTTNYNGTDSFTYTATDGTATSNTATVSITINAVNDAPVAVSNSYTTNEDTQLTGNVLTNDTDAEGNTLTATLATGPTHGTLTLNTDGTFTYTPTTNYNGTDSFTYTATDGTATSNTATVSITINAVNDAPVAVSNSYTTNEDTQLTGNVLTNDTDAEGNTITATLDTGPTHGTLTLNTDGTFTYTPTANYTGSDVFTYKANDGTVNSNTAVVSITVTPVNDTPVAVNDTYSTNEESPLNGNVLSNDTDADGNTLTATLVSGPANGTLTLNTDGTFTYTPTTNYNGTDSFTYTASDGTATSNTATVSITVNPVNDAPVAANDSYSTNEDVQLAGNVLSNDTDIDGNTLTTTLVSGPANGTLTLNTDGTFTYTPTTNYNGTDSFTYTASDGAITSNTATVTVTVNAVNDAPVATNDSYSTNQGIALNGNVLSNDTDADGNTLTASVVVGPAHGSLTLNANGSFTYTPATNYNGTDSFTYVANDGTANSTVATVSITIVDNVAPTALDVQTTNGGSSGYLDQGDTITYTFSEAIDPTTILPGWDGSTTNVVVRGYNGTLLNGLDDYLQIYDSTNSTILPLGTVYLGRQDYLASLSGSAPVTYGATGTASTMTLSGNTLTIVLGTYEADAFGVYRQFALGTGAMVWTPSTGTRPEDLAGNVMTTTSATESGTADRDF